MLQITLLTLLLLPLGCASTEKPPVKSEDDVDLAFIRAPPIFVSGFSQPDSAIHDPDADVYLVSNINGDPLDKKADNGFISKVSPEGKVLELKWIDGAKSPFTLNAPKGLALVGRRLYVADIDRVRIFDTKRGSAVGQVRIPKATYLNDISADPKGSLYVTDSGFQQSEKGLAPSETDAVFRIAKWGSVKRLASGKELLHPSGVQADQAGVWVVSSGSSQLFHLSSKGKQDSSDQLPAKQLEGLVSTSDGRFLVSSTAASTVLEGFSGTAFETNLKGVSEPGSLGYDAKRERVLVPLHGKNKLMIQPLSGFE